MAQDLLQEKGHGGGGGGGPRIDCLLMFFSEGKVMIIAISIQVMISISVLRSISVTLVYMDRKPFSSSSRPIGGASVLA